MRRMRLALSGVALMVLGGLFIAKSVLALVVGVAITASAFLLLRISTKTRPQ
jgi:divalent metal cation (Fe/Co/Zn/Cd) transporter